MGVLEGIRVIEIAEALAGPYAAMLMGDLGADVIKIERPGVGDQARQWGARLPGEESAYFAATNRNKRSLTLNIQKEEGRALLQSLLVSADVVILNIPREESLQRAALNWEALHTRHPRLIVASVTGYGRTGPYAGRSGYDLVAQGEAGLMALTGTPETVPMRYPVPLADMTAGLYTVIGVLAALRARDASGQGQHVDTSLLESQAAYLTILAGDYFATGRAPQPLGNAHPGIAPYQVFKTADRDVIIAVGSDKLWAQFCEVVPLGPEVRDDPRFATNPARLAHRAELATLIETRLATQTADDLLARLREAEIPCGPINSPADVLAHEQYLARGNVVSMQHPSAGEIRSLASPVRLSESVSEYRLPPPRVGEHTGEVLRDLGVAPQTMLELRHRGVV
ncbi:MAG: CoA transferase [Anaerolineales bacterium]|nr:CoA transferase [Anaerolineales bacterium]